MSRKDARRQSIEDLKIAVLGTGVRADRTALDCLGGPARLTTHEYPTTGGLACRVGDVFFNAPFDEWFCADADVRFTLDEGRPCFEHRERTFVIDEVFPIPSYVGRLDPEGHLYDEVVFSHLDRVRLSPIVGCAYDCGFCDLPGRIELRPLERLVRAGEMALQDGTLPIRHMLISGGSPGPRQWTEFAETVLGLVERFSSSIDVDVMMSAGSETAAYVRQLADAGLHGLAVNIELYSEDASRQYIRGKHRRARPYLAETVAAAVEVLGARGRVRSLIIPGIEPEDETLQGVELIASLGADPVLSPFRPAEGTRLARHRPVPPTVLRSVLDASRPIAEANGVSLGPRCLPCQHNTLAFPWDVPGGS